MRLIFYTSAEKSFDSGGTFRGFRRIRGSRGASSSPENMVSGESKKGAQIERLFHVLNSVTGAVSRVLSLDGHLSGTRVAARLKPPVGTGGPPMVPVGVAADRVYRPPMLPWGAVSSYLAFPPLLPQDGSGISLLHYSWGRPRRTLSVILALCSPDFPHAESTRPSAPVTTTSIPQKNVPVKPDLQNKRKSCILYSVKKAVLRIYDSIGTISRRTVG